MTRIKVQNGAKCQDLARNLEKAILGLRLSSWRRSRSILGSILRLGRLAAKLGRHMQAGKHFAPCTFSLGSPRCKIVHRNDPDHRRRLNLAPSYRMVPKSSYRSRIIGLFHTAPTTLRPPRTSYQRVPSSRNHRPDPQNTWQAPLYVWHPVV